MLESGSFARRCIAIFIVPAAIDRYLRTFRSGSQRLLPAAIDPLSRRHDIGRVLRSFDAWDDGVTDTVEFSELVDFHSSIFFSVNFYMFIALVDNVD